jgi:hypothetical protein
LCKWRWTNIKKQLVLTSAIVTNMVLAAGTGLVNPHFEFLYFEPGALQKTMPTVSSPVGIMFLLFTAGLECRVLLWTTFCFAKTIANRVLTVWREFLPTWFFFIGGEAGLTLTFWVCLVADKSVGFVRPHEYK